MKNLKKTTFSLAFLLTIASSPAFAVSENEATELSEEISALTADFQDDAQWNAANVFILEPKQSPKEDTITLMSGNDLFAALKDCVLISNPEAQSEYLIALQEVVADLKPVSFHRHQLRSSYDVDAHRGFAEYRHLGFVVKNDSLYGMMGCFLEIQLQNDTRILIQGVQTW